MNEPQKDEGRTRDEDIAMATGEIGQSLLFLHVTLSYVSLTKYLKLEKERKFKVHLLV